MNPRVMIVLTAFGCLPACGGEEAGGGEEASGCVDDDQCRFGRVCVDGRCAGEEGGSGDALGGGPDLQLAGLAITITVDEDSWKDLEASVAVTNQSSRPFIGCAPGRLEAGAFVAPVKLDTPQCDSDELCLSAVMIPESPCFLGPSESLVVKLAGSFDDESPMPVAPGTTYALTVNAYLEGGTPVSASVDAPL